MWNGERFEQEESWTRVAQEVERHDAEVVAQEVVNPNQEVTSQETSSVDQGMPSQDTDNDWEGGAWGEMDG